MDWRPQSHGCGEERYSAAAQRTREMGKYADLNPKHGVMQWVCCGINSGRVKHPRRKSLAGQRATVLGDTGPSGQTLLCASALDDAVTVRRLRVGVEPGMAVFEAC